jgi:ribosomal protein S18 acetylase RimI-like enzyme
MHSDSDCRVLTLSEVEQAAHIISQALVEDPLSAFMLPFKSTRVKALYKFFRAYGEVNIKDQRGFGVGEPLQGVAYWQLPDQGDLSISVGSLGAFLPLLFTLYPIGLFRARAVIRQIDALHTAHAAGPHFYLDNLGVLPSARGKGWSSRLIRPFLDRADAQKAIVYTDTVNPSNVPFYEHFGFQCVEASAVPGTDIIVYALHRPVQ